jgi:hypothetical protein
MSRVWSFQPGNLPANPVSDIDHLHLAPPGSANQPQAVYPRPAYQPQAVYDPYEEYYPYLDSSLTGSQPSPRQYPQPAAYPAQVYPPQRPVYQPRRPAPEAVRKEAVQPTPASGQGEARARFLFLTIFVVVGLTLLTAVSVKMGVAG